MPRSTTLILQLLSLVSVHPAKGKEEQHYFSLTREHLKKGARNCPVAVGHRVDPQHHHHHHLSAKLIITQTPLVAATAVNRPAGD